MTNSEIYKLAEEYWMKSHGWGLNYDQMLNAVYRRVDGKNDDPGDTVYIMPDGAEMSRKTAEFWCLNWQTFNHGFMVCYNHFHPDIKDNSLCNNRI